MSSFLKVKLDCAGWESKTQFEVNFKYCQEKNKHFSKIYQVQFFYVRDGLGWALARLLVKNSVSKRSSAN